MSEKIKIDQEYYDNSEYYQQNTENITDTKSSFQQYRIKKVLEIYKPNKNDRVLDIGCAWGTFSFMLASYSREVVGIDYSKKSIEFCNNRLKKQNVDNVNFVCTDARRTNLSSESFEVIIAADLFEHLYPEDSREVIKESYRLLKEKGKLVIWTPYRGHIFEIMRKYNFILKSAPSHVDYKTITGLEEELRKNNFNIIKSYYAESHVPIMKWLEKALLCYVPIFRRRIAILAEKK